MMIGIRVDANKEIAMGHLMRCMAIAQQLREMQEEVIFLTSEEDTLSFIKEKGFNGFCLGNSYKEKDKEVTRVLEFIQNLSLKKLLIDSYEITENYMKTIQGYCQVIYIDDLNLFRYPVDMVINYTIGTTKRIYEGRDYSEEGLVLGSRYVPLRGEFSKGRVDIRSEVSNVFITTGGTDKYDMILSILNGLDKTLEGVKKHVVVGKFYSKHSELQEVSSRRKDIAIYYNIGAIWDVMRECDLAISAGGTTLAELCACGVPTICFSVADNQLAGTETYAAEGAMKNAGDVTKDKSTVIDNIVYEVQCLLKDYELRKRLAHNANKLIDGNGARRIAEKIVAL